MSFVHLHVHTPFSFLDGAARIEGLVNAAALFEMPALAMTDHNNVSAAVRFHAACEAAGIKPIIGAELTLAGGYHLTLLAQNPRGYGSLCRIITDGHLSQPRLQPATSVEAIRQHSDGIIALSGCRRSQIPSLILERRLVEAEQVALTLRDIFGRDRFFLEVQSLGLPGTRALIGYLAELADHIGVGLVATNNIHHLRREDFRVHDVLTCARTLTRLDDIHPERRLNAQCYFRSPANMQKLFPRYPPALATAGRIAEMCEPALRPGRYRLPAYPVPKGETARGMLRRLTWEGAQQRYGSITESIRTRIEHELDVIGELGFDDYFLVVWDLLRFASERGIRYAGRGSAADSAVAHCLGITTVDPIARRLLFERFLSLERAALPDIDVDFQAERRDEVMHYVTSKYGQEHVAAVATYNTFQARSAVRDLGKAMGLPLAEVDRLARHLPYLSADGIETAFETVPELRDSGLPKERYQPLIQMCQAVAGLPRHLSTHLGGIVLTGEPLVDISPIQRAAKDVLVTQFDKDDVEDLGLIKLDLLCLRMLSAVDDAVRSIQAHDPDFGYESIPDDDKPSYNLVASADTPGVFQLESPAQRALHTRLRPAKFEDIVASVALIRPGPILANMVDPYIARRQGTEPITYLHPALERILSKTYGVVLFQEQVIEIATEIAGFTPGEADKLRRAMTHQRSWGAMEEIGKQFIQRARARGVQEPIARKIFSYIQAYAGYGFCEAHAAAFADTAYKTAYLKAHYPAEFYAGLLSHQPMGYYPPHTLVWDAKRRGIQVLGPDVNLSEGWFTVEDGAIRVSLAQIRGTGESSLLQILRARQRGGPFRSLEDFCRRVRVDRDVIRDIILCGAFDSICPNRRRLLWELDTIWTADDPEPALELSSAVRPPNRPLTWGPVGRGLHPSTTLRAGAPPAVARGGTRALQRQRRSRSEASAWPAGRPSPANSSALDDGSIPDFTPEEKWWHELDLLGIALHKHPVEFLREDLRRQGVITIAEARRTPKGESVEVAGLVIRPHRPPTRSGRTVVFFTLEDETGLLDVTVFESVYQRDGKAIFTEPIVTVAGRLDQRGPVGPAALPVRSRGLSPRAEPAAGSRESAYSVIANRIKGRRLTTPGRGGWPD